MGSLVRVIACLLFLTVSAEAAEGGWEGWAFETRGDGVVGWVGAWTAGGCAEHHRQAIGLKLDSSIGACHPVRLSDEPVGGGVWAIMRAEDGFVAATSPAICGEYREPPDVEARPVAFVSACQRVWLQVPSQTAFP